MGIKNILTHTILPTGTNVQTIFLEKSRDFFQVCLDQPLDAVLGRLAAYLKNGMDNKALATDLVAAPKNQLILIKRGMGVALDFRKHRLAIFLIMGNADFFK